MNSEFYRNKTRFAERNILNSAYSVFDGAGVYDIPILDRTVVDNLQSSKLQGFNFAMTSKHPENVGVHFFLHDYQFERVWNNPERYAQLLTKFKYVLSPDFSPYADLPFATQIFNIYRNRWCAKYWQEHGITVIPTITVGSEKTLDFISDGIPKHSTIAISTMGEGRWAKYELLYKYWDTLMSKLEPDTILLYGKDLSANLTGNIIFKPLVSKRLDYESED